MIRLDVSDLPFGCTVAVWGSLADQVMTTRMEFRQRRATLRRTSDAPERTPSATGGGSKTSFTGGGKQANAEEKEVEFRIREDDHGMASTSFPFALLSF